MRQKVNKYLNFREVSSTRGRSIKTKQKMFVTCWRNNRCSFLSHQVNKATTSRYFLFPHTDLYGLFDSYLEKLKCPKIKQWYQNFAEPKLTFLNLIYIPLSACLFAIWVKMAVKRVYIFKIIGWKQLKGKLNIWRNI